MAPVPIELHDIGAQHEIKPNETTLDSLDIKRSSQNYGLNGDVPRAKKQSHPDEESNVTEQPIRRESPVQMIIDDSEIVVENPDHSDVEWDGWETSENPSVSNWNENVSHASDLTLTTPQMLGIVNTQETSGAIPRKKSLGEEFEIKVVTASVSNLGSEPDYFADMQPIVPKKSDWLTQMASSVSSTTASARNSTDNKFKVFVVSQLCETMNIFNAFFFCYLRMQKNQLRNGM